MTIKRVVQRGLSKFDIEIHRKGYRCQSVNDPVELTQMDQKICESVLPYTMTGRSRIFALISSVRYVVNNRIPGDFIECGVWRGGSAMAIALVLNDLGVNDRRIWLYDTFEGMTSPTEEDYEVGTGLSAAHILSATEIADGRNVWCYANLKDVRANLKSTGYPENQLVFVQGDVAATLSNKGPDAISLLRLDTDWYESTKVEMEVLYPKLSTKGVCIIDDYGHWSGARQAIDEYFDNHGPKPLMNPIDYTGRLIIKV